MRLRYMRNQSARVIFFKVINFFVNWSIHRRKVFCIGLHKTGTSTIAHFVGRHGIFFTHSTDWNHKKWKLRLFTFFADGGSHFDGISEFDFEYLFRKYPDSLFILQTRDNAKWLISKMKHMGWTGETEIQKDDPLQIENENAKYKSILTLEKFLEHKVNYERKVKTFFEKNDPKRLLCIDVTVADTIDSEMRRLKEFMALRSVYPVQIPHKNKNLKKTTLSDNYKQLAKEMAAEWSSREDSN